MADPCTLNAVCKLNWPIDSLHATIFPIHEAWVELEAIAKVSITDVVRQD